MENEIKAQQDRKKYVRALYSKFGASIFEEKWQTPDQVTLTVNLNILPEIVEEAYYGQGGWLSNVIGNDERSINGHFAVYYVLSIEAEKDPDKNLWLTVKALVPADKPEFPSVAPRVPAAVWYEREVRDMLGLEPVGLPDARRLVLPDDWPDNLYPLRKDMDYRLRPEPAAEEENYEFIEVKGEGIVEVPLGPLHITSDEPGHFRLYVDGEYIVDADYRLFYVHRGLEKLAESRMDYNQVTFLAERICGICGYAHSVAYAMAVEAANRIEVPLRAQYIRTILLEVERIHSHLLNIGLAAHLVGFDSGFMHFFRIREKAMQMAEILTGGRKTYGMNLIGGVRRDILKEEKVQALRLISEIRSELKELIDMLLNTPNFISRTQGVGRLDPKVARNFGSVGPNLRGSGYGRDTRADHPYCAYKHVSWNVISKEGGDVLSRVLVRAEELFESLDIIERCLSDLPPGPILHEGFTYTPYTFALGYTEAPRGENVHWVMTANQHQVYRWRVRASTYNNWPVLRYMFYGNTVADAPLIVASIDPCYSCAERVTLVDVRKKRAKTVPYQELEQYCRERKYSPLKN
ncbi:hydrogenase 3 large subunit [Caldanaerobacter subterraneus subsp. yonseiensis KB-1]|uniref:Hydrogenase 3 large subunit n=1 Tax=Caldanaerobacter subterraneus subsp. yonseiensis KB-1 TaxID=1388761 RepID=U5CR01_CALSX|nr:hydrogenase 3 large subunit [Caldanaerobacter subterraneus subsp. yonseiensis KB-1]